MSASMTPGEIAVWAAVYAAEWRRMIEDPRPIDPVEGWRDLEIVIAIGAATQAVRDLRSSWSRVVHDHGMASEEVEMLEEIARC